MQLSIFYILYIYKSKKHEETMSGIQVTKTESGWSITKDGNTFSVTDKNKNGRWDSDELIKSLSGSGYLSADETYEAQYQIAQLGDGVTPEQMAQYQKYQQQKEAKEQYIQQQSTASTGKQKGKFWRNLSLGLTALTPLFGGLTGMFAGMGLGSWNYNYGNVNDTLLRISGAVTGGLFGMSATLPLVAGAFAQQQIPQQTGIYGGFNNNFTSFNANAMSLTDAMNAQNEFLEKIREQQEAAIAENKKKAEAQQKEQQEQKDKEYVESVIKETLSKDAIINADNKEYIKSLRDLDGERVYTKEEIANIKKIDIAELIPYRHVGNDASDKTKLSPTFAESLNNLILEYEKATGDNKYDIMPKEAYTEVTTIISKEKLTEEDVKRLQAIYVEYEANIPTDEE